MPGYIIGMLEPVSKIRLLDIPSLSADIVRVPCSNRMGTVSFRGVEGKGAAFLYTSLAFS
jgi:hypothetical protein